MPKNLLMICILFSQLIVGEIIGELSFDNRYFFNAGLQEQKKNHTSFTFSPEIFKDDSNKIFHFKAKLRKDTEDSGRNLNDIQELYLINILEDKEIKLGVSKEFWGVTETSHRVDIINQTDFTEGFDGEEKLGQPMIKISLERQWGLLDIYTLLGFRERNFSGNKGRLRLPLSINKKDSLYSSSSKNKRADFAIRWSNYYDDFDIAISHFSGTSREPRFLPSANEFNELVPVYDVIDQSGLEIQYLLDSLAIKGEVISRSGQGERFTAATYGFEYTQVGVLQTRIDLGWVVEFNHDDRLESSPFVLGTRLSFNDIYDSQILSGFIVNDKSKELGFLLEASRRIGECCMLSIEGVYFDDTDEDNGQKKLFQAFKQDDFLRAEFIYYL
ncbi:MAG: hypothetical protein CMG06_08365 [Candidatus Marinimicrobia bacterium]|nr:hypothetical protein [Candidatus Neomarinimicrobiota bacterium]